MSTDSDSMVAFTPFLCFRLHFWDLEHVDNSVLRSLSANYIIPVISVFVSTDVFFPLVTGHIFLHLCMSGHFWLDARHCALGIVGCWILLYSFK